MAASCRSRGSAKPVRLYAIVNRRSGDSAPSVRGHRATPEGIRVVLFEDTWLRHVRDPHSGHAELEPHLNAVLDAVAAPDHREPDAWPRRGQFFVTALDYGHGTIPRRMDGMNVKIDDLIFDHANYDADGDVLYLARGNTTVASEAALTPEGHGVRYDANGEVIGVTIINAQCIIGRDRHVTITLPYAVQVGAKELAAALG